MFTRGWTQEMAREDWGRLKGLCETFWEADGERRSGSIQNI